MQVHAVQPNMWVSYAISAAVIALVLFFRFRSMGKLRPLKVERLWVVPAIYVVLAGAMFVAAPPHGPIG